MSKDEAINSLNESRLQISAWHLLSDTLISRFKKPFQSKPHDLIQASEDHALIYFFNVGQSLKLKNLVCGNFFEKLQQ